MSPFVEVCCPSLESVRRAVQAGANRIELCERLEVGGVTPSLQLIADALAAAGEIPINVLVRPREGDFVYSSKEVDEMIDSIRFCKLSGVNGVVIGALTADGDIDLDLMKTLVREARPLEITFHRAFDQCRDVKTALEDVISLGVERLLTSGHCIDAYEGKYALKELVKLASGRIIVMPGCGITSANLEDIASVTGASEFHGSRLLQ